MSGNARFFPLLVVVALASYWLFPDYLLLLTQIFVLAIFALSYDLLQGFVGIVSLGHAAFFGIGAVAWSGGRIVLATPTGVGISDDAGETWTWSRAGLEDVTYSVNPLEEPVPQDEVDLSLGFTVVAMERGDRPSIAVTEETATEAVPAGKRALGQSYCVLEKPTA